MKVGDYVRTKDGIIDKVIIEYHGCCASQNCNCKHISCERDYYDEDKVIKSSPNIIDLIEVGDYVNEYLVYEIKENCVMVGYKCFKIEFDNEEDFLYQTIYANNIKSIVTKEQFESMKYRIGD